MEQAQAPSLSPKAVEMFRRLMMGAMKKLYADPKVTQGIVQMVGQAQDPRQGISQAASTVVQDVAQAAQQKGIPPEVSQMIQPAVESLVAELAQAAGVLQSEPPKKGLVGGAMEPQEQEA